VIVYTASHKSYADSVLDFLDPNGDLIKYRLYRHNCVQVKMESELIYVKDLRIFGNVKMEDMIIIDNSVLSFAFHLENGIPILPYYEKEDFELKFLSNYLNSIFNVKDLRVENNRSIKMPYFLKSVKDKIEGKNVENEFDNNNNNNLFKISLFSTEKITDPLNENENENECSYLDSENSTTNNNNNNEIDKDKDKEKITQFIYLSSEEYSNTNNSFIDINNNNNNSNNNSNLKLNNRKNEFHLQEILHNTLDNMRNNFSK